MRPHSHPSNSTAAGDGCVRMIAANNYLRGEALDHYYLSMCKSTCSVLIPALSPFHLQSSVHSALQSKGIPLSSSPAISFNLPNYYCIHTNINRKANIRLITTIATIRTTTAAINEMGFTLDVDLTNLLPYLPYIPYPLNLFLQQLVQIRSSPFHDLRPTLAWLPFLVMTAFIVNSIFMVFLMGSVWLRIRFRGQLLLVLIAFISFLGSARMANRWLPAYTDNVNNPIQPLNPLYMSHLTKNHPDFEHLHNQLFITDMHADTLLWAQRPFLHRPRYEPEQVPGDDDDDDDKSMSTDQDHQQLSWFQQYNSFSLYVGQRFVTAMDAALKKCADVFPILKQTDDVVRGHVDLPKLVQGRVAIQVFAVVSSKPRRRAEEFNEFIHYEKHWRKDAIAIKSLMEYWGWRQYNSHLEKAVFQIGRLRFLEHRSKGQFMIISSKAALSAFVAAYEQPDGALPKTAGMLAIEGAEALEGHIGYIDELYNLGTRIFGISHLYDNEFAGSAHGKEQGGLSELGELLVWDLEQKGFIIDVSHASDKTIRDIVKMSRRPVIQSHGNLRSCCPSSWKSKQLIEDELAREIVDKGGLIGISMFSPVVCSACIRRGYFGPSVIKTEEAEPVYPIQNYSFVEGVRVETLRCPTRANTAQDEKSDDDDNGEDDHIESLEMEPLLQAVARNVRCAVDVLGEDGVVLGSGWDGSVETPIDASQTRWLTAALLDQGLTANQIEKIMGGNFIRFFSANLPE